MTNRLLRYERALFRRSFADAFGGWRDKLLLILMLTLALLWLRAKLETASALSLPPEAVWLAALAGPAGLTWQRLILARLSWLAEHSPVAPDALDARTRGAYLVTAQLPAALPLLIGAALLATATGRTAAVAAIAGLAYAAGLALASLHRSPARRVDDGSPPERPSSRPQRPRSARQAAFRSILRRQTLGSAHPESAAALIAIAAFVLTAAAAWFGRDQPDALRFAAILLPSLLCLALLSRIDAKLIGFLAFAGYSPAFVAGAVSALPAASLAATAAALVAIRPPLWLPILGVLVLLHLGFIAIGIARAWLYPGRSGRSVDLQVQLEFSGLILIAFMLPPLAPVALAWRLWMLRRHYLSLLWVQL